jgi:hypothetical protein
VLDVEPPPGELREHQVAGDHHVLGGVGDAGEAEAGGDHPLVHRAAARELQLLGVDGDREVEGEAYSSARRITPARVTGRPSSVTVTAPAAIISPNSVSCSPFCPP